MPKMTIQVMACKKHLMNTKLKEIINRHLPKFEDAAIEPNVVFRCSEILPFVYRLLSLFSILFVIELIYNRIFQTHRIVSVERPKSLIMDPTDIERTSSNLSRLDQCSAKSEGIFCI